ncbi:hypothetical protein EVAR_100192_1 [Eumeta japonica]|uniref:Uncharacterized protein n=1 Tax=Eumeta variegata TaxID=151549 RepID=A0A4C2A6P2_EUMVA|nr:hypothetical protein EVAR_100192_1 [Eumeta japonica]
MTEWSSAIVSGRKVIGSGSLTTAELTNPTRRLSVNTFNLYFPDVTAGRQRSLLFPVRAGPACGPRSKQRERVSTAQRTILCRSELPAHDVMNRFNAPRPFLLLPCVPILRYCARFRDELHSGRVTCVCVHACV